MIAILSYPLVKSYNSAVFICKAYNCYIMSPTLCFGNNQKVTCYIALIIVIQIRDVTFCFNCTDLLLGSKPYISLLRPWRNND